MKRERSLRRRILVWGIVLGVLVGGGLWIRTCVNLMEARTVFMGEVRDYHKDAASTAVSIAFDLCGEYLAPETRGMLRQRKNALSQAVEFFGVSTVMDSYEALAWDVLGKGCGLACVTGCEDSKQRMFAILKVLSEMKALGASDPESMEELSKLRSKFEDQKVVLVKLFR